MNYVSSDTGGAAAPSALKMADAIRILTLDAVHRAKSGHQGMPLGMADVATVLWTKFLKFDPSDPSWPDRDRFVLSAGHGSMLLYALLYLVGTKGIGLDDLKAFRQVNSKTPGHPEFGHTPGVDCTTGPLGQGLAMAVGMALAERILHERFGEDIVDHRTWVIAGDGCLMEGVSHEAISLAAQHGLSKLVVLFDDNNVTIEGAADQVEKGDVLARFKAAGWAARRIDGHDHAEIETALNWATRQDAPVLLACRTRISRGAGVREGDPHSHGYTFFDDGIAEARTAMQWPWQPFEVPADVKTAWEEAMLPHTAARALWQGHLESHPMRRAFATLAEPAGDAIKAPIAAFVAEHLGLDKPEATRASSGKVLERLVPYLPGLIGGSADLSDSNNTFVKGMSIVEAPSFAGQYVRYGVREFAMAAAMNGMAVHGGLIPYGGTFLVFSDYAKAAIRLSALMRAKVVYVLTHDSIGVGEDGPTHQPVEHLAAFRAMPGLLVLRPADAVETAECWKAALTHDGPSILALSRQALPRVRTTAGNLALKGAYELSGTDRDAVVSIFASGSEVQIALQAQARLNDIGIPSRVVSTPCWELFDGQDDAYRAEVLGDTMINVAIEAAAQLGWEKFIGRDGIFIGMHGFGASAPANQLYRHLGITAEAVVQGIGARISAGATIQI